INVMRLHFDSVRWTSGETYRVVILNHYLLFSIEFNVHSKEKKASSWTLFAVSLCRIAFLSVIYDFIECTCFCNVRLCRYYKRLQTLVKDPRHDCVLFANEFQKYSYCPREKGETAVWYYNHLAGMMNIVMITEDPEAVAQFSSLTSGVYVISVQDYLQSFWSDLQAAHELFSSISQAQQETEGDDGEKEFPEHLPAEVLEAGIKSERYIQSTLNVNKHRAQNEAFVRPKNFSNKSTGENALHFQNSFSCSFVLMFLMIAKSVTTAVFLCLFTTTMSD
uniref:Uncharacterized protein n=1 Tax=Maylandia zebra TaxID=106582 RepID=A0A3P9DHF7_9CICH